MGELEFIGRGIGAAALAVPAMIAVWRGLDGPFLAVGLCGIVGSCVSMVGYG